MTTVNVTGTIIEGVEHNSYVLMADPGAPESCYQVGQAGAPYLDQRVRLTGRLMRDAVSITMQGVLVAIDEITPLTEDATTD